MCSTSVVIISHLVFCTFLHFGSPVVAEDEILDPWVIFNKLSSTSNGSFVSEEDVKSWESIENPVYNETESESKEKARFPDFVLNPDSLNIGSSVVDAIIKDNTASKSSVGAVYPGVMELSRIKVKIQCTGRECDHNIDQITSPTEHFVSLPLFGRTNVVITLVLAQEFEIHQIEMKLMTYNQKYHFKVRQKTPLGKRTMFEISNNLLDCGSDFNIQIREMCRKHASFLYGGDEPSRLDLGVDWDLDNSTGPGSISDWSHTRTLEIVLFPASGGPTVYGINNLKIFGRCICNGHGSECTLLGTEYHCTCQGNTCGPNCDSCCPKYNAFPWKAANSSSPNPCTECLCYGKVSSCHYDRKMETQYRSFITETQRGGGGVCDACSGDTSGINCETCKPRFYRPANLTAWAPFPCIDCYCYMGGVVRIEGWPDGDCVKDSSFRNIQGRQMTAGQCFCKEGWTGRRCDVCSDGWYRRDGDCVPCGCSDFGSVSGLCEQSGGRCQCKVGYKGRRCDRCADRMFHFPKCTESCTGNRAGVHCETCLEGFYLDKGECRKCSCSRHSSCDRETGSCSCLAGYTGPSCHSCVSEQLLYPECRNCSCSRAGSQTGCVDCVCKELVEGRTCDRCKSGNFALSPLHETGCLPCYCSYVSAQCTAAVTATSLLSSLFDFSTDGWTLTDGTRTSTSSSPHNQHVADFSFYSLPSSSSSVFFSAPRKFLGNRATSYGGFLNFSYSANFLFEHRANDSLHVWLVGKDAAVKHLVRGQMDSDKLYTIRIQLLESMWESRSGNLKRSSFMDILVDLRAILISASFLSPFKYTRLRSPSLTTRTILTPLRALVKDISPSQYVEQCVCPFGYSGPSCETCIDGYFKNGKVCQKCDCNSRADTCDESGNCLDCREGTTGPDCNVCQSGYYPSSLSPLSCTPCPCPYNGSCLIDSEKEVRCTKCLPGVTGKLCDRCMKGYYGSPEFGCKRCPCNGNLDMSREEPCDQSTGRCITCLEGTDGTFCEKCSPDYWSSIPGRDCQRCDCPLARRILVPCNPRTGDCFCKSGYTGRNCSVCQPYTYGYLNDEDCKNCSCDVEGSHSLHCNGTSGECFCKRGHVGRKCDRCREGFWRLPRQPCSDCECSEIGSTSPICSSSGQCTCAVGYTGRDCSECQTGYIRNGTQQCSECDNCARKILVTLEETSVKQDGIKPQSQDFFISKTTAKLKRLQKKSNSIKDKMLHRIALFTELTETVTDVFSPSKQTKPGLHRRTTKLMVKYQKLKNNLDDVALGLDSSVAMKNLFFRDAYIQYEYAMYRLPKKLADLSVSRAQLRDLSREVERIDDRHVDTILSATTDSRDKFGKALKKAEVVQEASKDHKRKVREAGQTVSDLSDRVADLTTTLVELQYDQVDGSLLSETMVNLEYSSYIWDKFFGWKSEVEQRVEGIKDEISGSSLTVRIQDLNMLTSDVRFLRQALVDLPSTLPPLLSLDSSSCVNTAKLIRSMYNLFSVVLLPQPVRDINLVREIISNIDTVAELQELTVKYRNTEKLAERVKKKSGYLDQRKISRLKSAMQSSNHRLKELEDQNTLDKDRLKRVETHLQILTTSNVHPHDSYETKMGQLKEDLSNLTWKKRKFRALEKGLTVSMDRIQRKIDAIKVKVLAFESISFDKNDWSRYVLPDRLEEIRLGFRSSKNSGTILSVGQTGKEEDLLISVSQNTISFTCYEPTTLPMYTICPDSDSAPCYPRLGSISYSEWYDPRATFDPTLFASLHIIFEYGSVTVNAYQQERLFFSQTAPCLITPESLALTKRPSRGSGLVEAGFSGCITQLQINQQPRGIRQANHTVGVLRRCEDKGYVPKSVRESECGMSYLSLSDRTLLQPSFSEKLRFHVLVGSLSDRVTIMSMGPLKITARNGKIFGTCNQLKMRITFRSVYTSSVPFEMDLELFENYISLTVSRTDNENRTRKLPCVLRPEKNEFYVGSDTTSIDGCIKKI
ncbi:hypothetical protein ACHWQZ_G007057 [Mnemiopsis leidyi]